MTVSLGPLARPVAIIAMHPFVYRSPPSPVFLNSILRFVLVLIHLFNCFNYLFPFARLQLLQGMLGRGMSLYGNQTGYVILCIPVYTSVHIALTVVVNRGGWQISLHYLRINLSGESGLPEAYSTLMPTS